MIKVVLATKVIKEKREHLEKMLENFYSHPHYCHILQGPPGEKGEKGQIGPIGMKGDKGRQVRGIIRGKIIHAYIGI